MVINADNLTLQRIQDAHQMLVRLASHAGSTGGKLPYNPPAPPPKLDSNPLSAFEINKLA